MFAPQILALQANKLQGSYPLEWGPDTAFPLLEELYLQSNLVRIALLCKPFRFHTLSPVAPHVLGLPAMLCCDTQRTCLSESACAMQLEGSLPRTGPGGAVQFPRTRIIDLSCALPVALPANRSSCLHPRGPAAHDCLRCVTSCECFAFAFAFALSAWTSLHDPVASTSCRRCCVACCRQQV